MARTKNMPPPSSSRRRTTAVGTQNSREDRKRKQNQLSQKCLREKRLLRTRQLASAEKLIDRSIASSSAEDQRLNIEELSTQLLQAVEQNRKLSDALLRMRKKLLSIGTSATSAGVDTPSDYLDDDIFEELLGISHDEPQEKPQDYLKDSPREIRTPSAPTSPSFDTNFLDDIPGYKAAPVRGGNIGSGMGLDGQLQKLMAVGTGGQAQTNLDNNSAPGQPQHDDSNLGQEQIDPWLLDQSANQLFDFMPNGYGTLFSNHQTETQNTKELCNNHDYTSLINLQTCCLFAQAVEETCSRFASQIDTIQMIENGNRVTERLLNDLVKVAAYLIAIDTKVENYVYAVGIDKILACLLRWRISQSRETAAAIPPPFCPTPLQLFRPDHHIAVDCCVWPAIRDQMILQHAAIDFDKFYADLLQHAVLEVPYLASSVSILDLYLSDILPKESGDERHDHGSDPAAALSGIDGPDMTLPEVQPLNHSLLNELCRRMTREVPSDIHSKQIPTRSYLSTKFGLNNFKNWKLSKDFAAKYSFLDCSSAESKYPTVSTGAVLGVGLWVLAA
ncbi:MAG: hypothetical protein M1818_005042 [Claussenomyces sp. TS43310]|nr:MAG: hypothetical protein M1818_005042 [Claussenomyces sp. TS43310]